MPARVLLIGLDGAEPVIFGGNGSDNLFPTLSAMRSSGASGRLVGHHELLTDTVWPELRSGSSGIRTGTYYQPRQIRTGERRVRARRPDELNPERFYWNVAAESGLRVAAVDQPLAPGYPAGRAVEVVEWGTHDRCGFKTAPTDPGAARIVRSHGDHPIWLCERINDGRPEGRQRLLAKIKEGVDRKAALLTDLLDSDNWDLFTAAFSESHCVGHHFWPLTPDDRGDVDRAEPGAAVINKIYSRLDAAVGTLVQAAGAGATVIVYASHGMGPADDGTPIVAEVLERMGLVAGNRRRRNLAARVPPKIRGSIQRVIRPAVVQRVGLTHDRPLGDRGTVAIPLPNSRHGAIRLSLAGRDPGGTLEEGSADYRRVLDDLRREFTALQTVDTGDPVVEDVLVTNEVFGDQHHPDLPDVLIRFRGDIGVIRECRSDSLGTIRTVSAGYRTGEHGTPGAIWATGPVFPKGSSLGDVQAVDLAPSVLAALDLPIPGWIDGTPVAGLRDF